ncbi:MAG: M28 family peptidase, partial [Proteobacteria bacterium]|nr:M28 family peptidase [Pseudomonadota bacterium]
ARQHLRRYASLRYKAMVARDRGARGILVVSGPNSKVRQPLVPLSFDASLAGSSIAALSLSDAAAERLLAADRRNLGKLQSAWDGGARGPAFVLDDVRISGTVELVQERRRGRNVLARLQVGRRPSESVVLVGAHVDHLGREASSASLARDDERGQIHWGADDNASGVAALLGLAEAAAARVRGGERGAQHDLVFAAWSGEELGLLGSTHYAESRRDPGNPHAALSPGIRAYLNLDMVGRLRNKLLLYGMASSPAWAREVERANAPLALPVMPLPDSTLPTDATPFYLRGVPILSAFTGVHSEYHTPRDTVDRLNFAGLRQTSRLFDAIAWSLAQAPEPPQYVAAGGTSQAMPRGGLRVFLGTVPDYARTGEVGVRLSGVISGGPAEQAGLRGGDLIVEVAGRSVENVYDYTYALDALAVGEPVEIEIQRGDQTLRLEIVPGSRD